jgi:hypothetical protein
VHGGTLQSFSIGIDLELVNNSQINAMEISKIHAPSPTLQLFDTAGIKVAGTTNLVNGNQIEETDIGVLLPGGPGGHLLIGNEIEDSTTGISLFQSGGFIFANRISGCDTAISIVDTAGSTVESCILTKNGSGIIAAGPGTMFHLIRRNTATDNRDFGIKMDLRAGLNTITENVAERNGTDDLFDFGIPPSGQGCVNTWLRNTFKTANKSCIH